MASFISSQGGEAHCNPTYKGSRLPAEHRSNNHISEDTKWPKEAMTVWES